MLLDILYLVIGLILLVWSADKFVDGASATARYLGLSPLLIGIVIVGFGTSTPEMLVSASSALDGASGLALGNAYGSNIANIALILGATAVISPILVAKDVLKKELPALLAITALSAYFLTDATVTQTEAVILLVVFAIYMVWRIWDAKKFPIVEEETNQAPVSLKKSVFWLVVGLLLLMVSSKLMVVGAVSLAKELGVSDLVIGLTIVAVGTSLPELASSIIAARKGESDLALGNIVGSNLFNTLVVVGIAGVISPMQVEPDIFSRDMLVMSALTVLLALCCYPFSRKKQGKITRFEGFLLILCFVGYTLYLLKSVI